MSRWNQILLILTLRCEGASELASRELDERLPALDRAAMFCHLALCHSCRRFRTQIRWIREAARRREPHIDDAASEEAALSPEARERIALAIRRAALDEPSDGGRHP